MTTIYSPFPADCLWPSVAKDIYRKALPTGGQLPAREDYPALPWAMEDLVGTVWCNLHTGSRITIEELRPSRLGYDPRPEPVGAGCIVMGFEGDGGIGDWSGERFIIEHWVRVDHLDHDAQQRWEQVRLRYNWAEAHGGRMSKFAVQGLQGRLF